LTRELCRIHTEKNKYDFEAPIEQYILTYLGVCDYRRGMDWTNWIYWPLVCTPRNCTLQITDTHRLVSSVYYSFH
jgi:hypothetical protein